MKSYTKVDLSRYISLQIKALKLCGIWFYISHPIGSLKFWKHLLCRIFIGIFVFIIPTGAQFIHLIKIMKGDAEIQEVAAIINLVLTELLTSFKLLDLYLRRHLLMQLVEHINMEEFNLVPVDTLKVVEKSILVSRRMFLCLLLSTSFDVFVHVIVVPTLNGFRTLPLKMDFVFLEVNEETYFKYICAYQILYKPIMIVTFVTIQTLPWAFMSCATSQLDVLICNFENMKEFIKATKSKANCDDNKVFKNIFIKCIRHHFAIKRYICAMQAVFGGQFSSTLALNACIVCTTAVQFFSIESPLDNMIEILWIFLYLLVLVSILFVDCFLGNSITIKSARVSTAAYSCPWVELAPELKRNLVVFIAEAQRPLIIVAGKLVPVSLETFTKKSIWNCLKIAGMEERRDKNMISLSQEILRWIFYRESSINLLKLEQVMNWTYKGFAVMNQMKK